ncbi:MAG: hypothetical protein HQK83_20125 [Fibrobacteria bacterium]|nr:hypothetical protein [Fibrobacteria bacterium]
MIGDNSEISIPELAHEIGVTERSIEIKESILAYLKATFTFQDKEVHKAFYNFINHPTDGMFKGPYLSLKLPFVKVNSEVEAERYIYSCL